MKKLMMFVMALVFAAAFASGAYAAESAQLGLSVTFAPNNPVTIRTDPEGPFKIESGKELVFTVNADNATSLKCESPLPYGATFTVVYLHAVPIDGQGGSTSAIGTFKWTPKNLIYSGSDALTPPIELTFCAGNSSNEVARLVVEITVIRPEPVISIELNESDWKLDGVKLGEKRSNLNDLGLPIHMVRNTGNVPVLVDIGYAPGLIYLEWAPKPGLEQGPGRFTTETEGGVIPPDGRMKVAKIAPESARGIRLTFGAPTSVESVATGGPVTRMGTAYELRAYPAIVVDPPMTTNEN